MNTLIRFGVIAVQEIPNIWWRKPPTAAEINAYQASIADPNVRAPRDISGLFVIGVPLLFVGIGILANVLAGL